MPRDPNLLELARKLRQDMTPAEQILWRKLRNRRFQDWKFRRQHIIGQFIADFYCPQIQLLIELDGETHIGREEHDHERQDALEAMGVTVLRFWNPEVYDEKEAVLEMIFRVCMALSGGRTRIVIFERSAEWTVIVIEEDAYPSPPGPSPQSGRGESIQGSLSRYACPAS